MEEFSLAGDNNFIKISLVEVNGFPATTSHWGGYDAQCKLDLQIGDYSVSSSFYSSTGEIFEFYQDLAECNDLLSGTVYFRNYEDNLLINLQYDVNGSITILGSYRSAKFDGMLNFNYKTDQSFIQSTLQQLKKITAKYGGMKGIDRS